MRSTLSILLLLVVIAGSLSEASAKKKGHSGHAGAHKGKPKGKKGVGDDEKAVEETDLLAPPGPGSTGCEAVSCLLPNCEPMITPPGACCPICDCEKAVCPDVRCAQDEVLYTPFGQCCNACGPDCRLVDCPIPDCGEDEAIVMAEGECCGHCEETTGRLDVSCSNVLCLLPNCESVFFPEGECCPQCDCEVEECKDIQPEDCEGDQSLFIPPQECCPRCGLDCTDVSCTELQCEPGFILEEPDDNTCCPECVPLDCEEVNCDYVPNCAGTTPFVPEGECCLQCDCSQIACLAIACKDGFIPPGECCLKCPPPKEIDCSLVDCLVPVCGVGEVPFTPEGECCPTGCIELDCDPISCEDPPPVCGPNEKLETPSGECCPMCMDADEDIPDCANVRCAFPICAPDETTATPEGSCCLQCLKTDGLDCSEISCFVPECDSFVEDGECCPKCICEEECEEVKPEDCAEGEALFTPPFQCCERCGIDTTIQDECDAILCLELDCDNVVTPDGECCDVCDCTGVDCGDSDDCLEGETKFTPPFDCCHQCAPTPSCDACDGRPYFDGCNRCFCDEDGQASCSKVYCSTIQFEPYCEKPPPTDLETLDCDQCPYGYFDGCNECECTEEGIGLCELTTSCDPEGFGRRPACNAPPRDLPGEDFDCRTCESGKFFDGCNSCYCNVGEEDETIVSCWTDAVCEGETPDPECIKPDEALPSCETCPSGKYNDGCNDCYCDPFSGLEACTEIACEEPGKPKCVVDCTTCESGRYNDGCNECFCEENGSVGCTERACFVQGEPFCIELSLEETVDRLSARVDDLTERVEELELQVGGGTVEGSMEGSMEGSTESEAHTHSDANT